MQKRSAWRRIGEAIFGSVLSDIAWRVLLVIWTMLLPSLQQQNPGLWVWLIVWVVLVFLVGRGIYSQVVSIDPRLELTWKPGEPTYHHEFVVQGVRNILFRVCVKADRAVSNVKVRMEGMTPHEITHVPMFLRLMHNIQPPWKEHFDLERGEPQFVDLIQQQPERGVFIIWHTVGTAENAKVAMTAQSCKFTVSVRAGNVAIHRHFEMVKNGPVLWAMRELDAA